ncbi:MAG: PadR family transcriptional regulator [Pseudomonadota bacterium]
MPRQHRNHGEPPIPPTPPIPPMPPEAPEPPMGCEGRGVRFGDVVGLFATGPRSWHRHWGPFHFDVEIDDDGRGRGRGRGPRGRSRRMFESGELRLVLLKLISEEPRHGYDLIRAIEELTGGEYAPSPGVVYPTLTLLQDMGLIEEAPGEGSRKPFQITKAGTAHLEENSDEVEELIERLKDLAPREGSNAGPAIGRAVKNLMTALKHRVGRDGLNDDLLHEIAAILDDAAQRIERIK